MNTICRLKQFASRLRRDDSGATALEFSLVAVIFVFASIGVMELGRTYQVRNELSYAADIGGRRLTILVNTPSVDPDDYDDEVKAEIVSIFQGYDPSALVVDVDPETVNGVQYQRLTLQYPMSVFIPFQSSTYQLKVVRRAVQL